MTGFFICAAVSAGGSLVSSTAWAGEPPSADAESDEVVQLTAGIKGGASGNFLNDPDDDGPGSTPFDEGAGGWGGGGGLFAEARFFNGHLGVETGLSVDYARNKSTITLFDVVETEWGWKQTSLRIPLLIQGGTGDRKGKPRFAVGVGPEFVIPVSSKPLFDINEGSEFVMDRGIFEDDFTVRDKAQVNLLTNLGLGIPVGPLRLTFDIRYAIFFGLPDSYESRVTFSAPAMQNLQTDVLAQYNMDLRLLVGLGYDFRFGGKK